VLLDLKPKRDEYIQLYFDAIDDDPDFVSQGDGKHGRLETRKIWVTTRLNDYLNFPCVGQVFMIERNVIKKSTMKTSQEIIFGITRKSADKASAEQVLQDNRKHWVVESCHYIINWNYDEDRSNIRTGFGPENMTRLRRFAIGLLKARQKKNINETIKQSINDLCVSVN